MRNTYDLQAKSVTTSEFLYIVTAVVPLWPLFEPTDAKLFAVVYARSSYFIPIFSRKSTQSIYRFPRNVLHKINHLQPSIPPLPVDRNRPLQFSGSHSSNDMLDLFDVGIDSPTRQRFTVTS